MKFTARGEHFNISKQDTAKHIKNNKQPSRSLQENNPTGASKPLHSAAMLAASEGQLSWGLMRSCLCGELSKPYM